MSFPSFAILLIASLFVLASARKEEYVQTPNGLIPARCAYEVPDGTHIVHHEASGGAEFRFPDGGVKFVDPCEVPLPAQEKRPTDAPPAGWQAYTYWVGPNNITSFLGNWNTPSVPPNPHGQLLYLFTGLQNNCGGYGKCPSSTASNNRGVRLTSEGLIAQDTNILQPVLQYGSSPAGGGSYWAIASWYVATVGTVYTPAKKIAAGDSLFGNMTKESATSETWFVEFTDVTDPTVQTSLKVTKGKNTQFEPDAYVTLEVYEVSNCKQYPTESVQFTELAITDASGPITPVWKEYSYATSCNETATIVSANQVTIQW